MEDLKVSLYNGTISLAPCILSNLEEVSQFLTTSKKTDRKSLGNGERLQSLLHFFKELTEGEQSSVLWETIAQDTENCHMKRQVGLTLEMKVWEHCGNWEKTLKEVLDHLEGTKDKKKKDVKTHFTALLTQIMLVVKAVNASVQESRGGDSSKKQEQKTFIDNRLTKEEKANTSDRNNTAIDETEFLKKQIESLQKQLHEETERFETRKREFKTREEQLSSKLSKEMAGKLLAATSQFGPDVRTCYSDFQSSEWADAKEFLDNSSYFGSWTQPKKFDILHDITEITYTEVFRAWAALKGNLGELILHPVESAASLVSNGKTGSLSGQDGREEAKESLSNIPEDMRNPLSLVLRQQSEKCNYEGLINVVTSKISDKHGKKWSHLEGKEIKDYIGAMTRLCWTMAICEPQMTFDFEQKWLGSDWQDLFYESVQTENPEEVHIVHPVLKERNTLVAKGKVFLL